MYLQAGRWSVRSNSLKLLYLTDQRPVRQTGRWSVRSNSFKLLDLTDQLSLIEKCRDEHTT